MQRILLITLLALWPLHASAAAKKTRLWNLTGATITKFELAPVGETNWGPDQCKNDKDGSVDHDERLAIEGVPDGTYDARIGYGNGRTCFARNLKVETGKVFTIDEDQLKDCSNPK